MGIRQWERSCQQWQSGAEVRAKEAFYLVKVILLLLLVKRVGVRGWGVWGSKFKPIHCKGSPLQFKLFFLKVRSDEFSAVSPLRGHWEGKVWDDTALKHTHFAPHTKRPHGVSQKALL